jgi:hypothetical protein
MRDWHRDVLFFAAGVRKAEVNEFDLVVADHFHYIGYSLGHEGNS